MDAWEFWRLVDYLPAYEGATRLALKTLAQRDALPAQQSQPAVVHRTENGEKITEVNNASPEHLLAAFGPGLISFGSGE